MNARNPHPILVVSGVRGDTRRYRAFHLHQQLRLAGVECALSHLTDPHLPERVSRADVLVLHRVAYDDYVARLIAVLRRRGGLLLVDTDDLIFDPQAFKWIDSPDFRDPVRARLYRQEMARHRRTLEAADGALASTDYLANYVRSSGKPAWVHRNAACLEMVRRSEQARSRKPQRGVKLVVGYASGTPTHNNDFATIAPPLQAALRDWPELEVWIIGHLDLDSSWAAYSGRLQRFASVDWRALPSWLSRLDINLAPLVADNPFSQSKSEIKFMEAALVGLPTLAARTDAFQFAIRDGENGFLSSGPQEWTAKLTRLRQAEVRESLGKQAHVDASAGYAPEVRSRQAIALLNEAASTLGRSFSWEYHPAEALQPAEYDWPPEFERRPTFAEMGLYTLRNRGMRTLTGQTWVFFRRWLAKFIPYA